MLSESLAGRRDFTQTALRQGLCVIALEFHILQRKLLRMERLVKFPRKL